MRIPPPRPPAPPAPPFHFKVISKSLHDPAFEHVRLTHEIGGVEHNYGVFAMWVGAAAEIEAWLYLAARRLAEAKEAEEKKMEGPGAPVTEEDRSLKLIHMSDAEVLTYIEDLRKKRLEAAVTATIQRAERSSGGPKGPPSKERAASAAIKNLTVDFGDDDEDK